MLFQNVVQDSKSGPRCYISRGFEIKVLRYSKKEYLDAKLIKLVKGRPQIWVVGWVDPPGGSTQKPLNRKDVREVMVADREDH